LKQHANWIAGGPRGPAGAGRVELGAPDSASLGSWPRSGAADVEQALEAAAAGGERWRARSRSERLEILSAAARALAAAPDPEGLAARALGLERAELAQALTGLAHVLRAAPDDDGGDGHEGEGGPDPRPLLLESHWSELFAPLGRRLFAALAAGRPAVVIGAARLPMIADRFAAVLQAAGLDAGALAVLHDDGDTALRAALAGGGFCALRATGRADHLARLARAADDPATAPGFAAFGAGVLERPATVLCLGTPERARARVESDDDPVPRAREVAARSFGRVECLSGQGAGQVGMVEVAPRLLSRFTAALLDCLDARGPDAPGGFDRPLPFLEHDLADDLVAARELGLDEGATLIHEGTASDSPSGRREARLVRLVFTNVEPDMRVLGLERPMPLLCLMRGSDGLPEGWSPGSART
jgi:acyl-CoA reductase-like NAD-dependent aldehyde dehydrogenase